MQAHPPDAYYSNFPHQPRSSDSTQATKNSSLTGASSSTSLTTASPVSTAGALGPTDNVLNRVADKGTSLFQRCVTLRKRLSEIPGFEEQAAQAEAAEEEMDPVSVLWNTFRRGYPLVSIFNTLRPNDPVRVDPVPDNVDDRRREKLEKAAAFKFSTACMQRLNIPPDECFIVSDLTGNDTGGLVKVIRVVDRVLDLLIQEGIINDLQDADGPAAAAGKKTHRQHVIEELVKTERTYVQHLEQLQSFKRLVESRGVITGDSIHDIFLNLNALLDFQRRFLIRVEQINAEPEDLQNWGRLFLQYSNAFPVYEPYIQNQKRCEAIAMQEFARLRDAGGSLENRQMVESPTHFTSFLLKPFQRLSKYPLLLKELLNKGDYDEARKEDLREAMTAVQTVLERANAYIAQEELDQAVQDLKGQVDDWKGHRVEAFGRLLLHGTFTVHKGDPNKDEREYRMYLFEKILLCCKEMNKDKQKRMMKPPPVDRKGRPRLQLKGRIFMQNVTDTSSTAGPTGYLCQIFWRGDEAIESFIIRFTTEEVMKKWRDQIETLRRSVSESLRQQAAGSTSTSDTDFTYMRQQGAGAHENPYVEADEEDDFTPTGSFTISRNASSTSLRSRSTTGESSQRPRQASNFSGVPLQLRTNVPGAVVSPMERAGNSYFSPGGESPMSSRASGASSLFPQDSARHTPPHGWSHNEDPNRFTAPVMGRPVDPRAPRGPTSAYPAHAASLAQSRMRSASSPDIHNVNNPAHRRMVNNTPPVPSIPAQLAAQSNAAGRTSSPNGYPSGAAISRAGYPAAGRAYPVPAGGRMHGQSPTENGLSSPPLGSAVSYGADSSGPSQLKVKVKVPSEGSTMTLVVGSNIAFQSLKERIDAKMARYTHISLASGTVKLKYLYEDEFVSIQTDEDVQTAFELWREQQMEDPIGQFGEIELYCQ